MKCWTVYTVSALTGEWINPVTCETWEEVVEVITKRCINGGIVSVAVVVY